MRSALVALWILLVCNLYAILTGVGSSLAAILVFAFAWLLFWAGRRARRSCPIEALPSPRIGHASLTGVATVLLEYGQLTQLEGSSRFVLYFLVLFLSGAVWAASSPSGPGTPVWIAICTYLGLQSFWYLRFIGSDSLRSYYGGELYWIAQEQVSAWASFLPLHALAAWAGWQVVDVSRRARPSIGRRTMQ